MTDKPVEQKIIGMSPFYDDKRQYTLLRFNSPIPLLEAVRNSPAEGNPNYAQNFMDKLQVCRAGHPIIEQTIPDYTKGLERVCADTAAEHWRSSVEMCGGGLYRYALELDDHHYWFKVLDPRTLGYYEFPQEDRGTSVLLRGQFVSRNKELEGQLEGLPADEGVTSMITYAKQKDVAAMVCLKSVLLGTSLDAVFALNDFLVEQRGKAPPATDFDGNDIGKVNVPEALPIKSTRSHELVEIRGAFYSVYLFSQWEVLRLGTGTDAGFSYELFNPTYERVQTAYGLIRLFEGMLRRLKEMGRIKRAANFVAMALGLHKKAEAVKGADYLKDIVPELLAQRDTWIQKATAELSEITIDPRLKEFYRFFSPPLDIDSP